MLAKTGPIPDPNPTSTGPGRHNPKLTLTQSPTWPKENENPNSKLAYPLCRRSPIPLSPTTCHTNPNPRPMWAARSIPITHLPLRCTPHHLTHHTAITLWLTYQPPANTPPSQPPAIAELTLTHPTPAQATHPSDQATCLCQAPHRSSTSHQLPLSSLTSPFEHPTHPHPSLNTEKKPCTITDGEKKAIRPLDFLETGLVFLITTRTHTQKKEKTLNITRTPSLPTAQQSAVEQEPTKIERTSRQP